MSRYSKTRISNLEPISFYLICSFRKRSLFIYAPFGSLWIEMKKKVIDNKSIISEPFTCFSSLIFFLPDFKEGRREIAQAEGYQNGKSKSTDTPPASSSSDHHDRFLKENKILLNLYNMAGSEIGFLFQFGTIREIVTTSSSSLTLSKLKDLACEFINTKVSWASIRALCNHVVINWKCVEPFFRIAFNEGRFSFIDDN